MMNEDMALNELLAAEKKSERLLKEAQNKADDIIAVAKKEVLLVFEEKEAETEGLKGKEFKKTLSQIETEKTNLEKELEKELTAIESKASKNLSKASNKIVDRFLSELNV